MRTPHPNPRKQSAPTLAGTGALLELSLSSSSSPHLYYSNNSQQNQLQVYEFCNTPIGGTAWASHLADLRALRERADRAGAWLPAFELTLLIAGHVGAELQARGGTA